MSAILSHFLSDSGITTFPGLDGLPMPRRGLEPASAGVEPQQRHAAQHNDPTRFRSPDSNYPVNGRAAILILSTGLGILVIPIIFACMVCSSMALDQWAWLSNNSRYAGIGYGMVAASIILWPLGRWANHDKPYWEQHSLFLVPIEWCAPVCLLLGLATLLAT